MDTNYAARLYPFQLENLLKQGKMREIRNSSELRSDEVLITHLSPGTWREAGSLPFRWAGEILLRAKYLPGEPGYYETFYAVRDADCLNLQAEIERLRAFDREQWYAERAATRARQKAEGAEAKARWLSRQASS